MSTLTRPLSASVCGAHGAGHALDSVQLPANFSTEAGPRDLEDPPEDCPSERRGRIIIGATIGSPVRFHRLRGQSKKMGAVDQHQALIHQPSLARPAGLA
jgi:hypothetical protein